MTHPHWYDDEDGAQAAWHQKLMEEQQQSQEEHRMAKSRMVGGPGYEPVEVGVHRAVCHLLVDLGLQPGNPMFKNEKGEVKDAYKLVLGFQLPDVLDHNGLPRVISNTFTNIMAPKSNLRKVVESWFGKAFPSQQAADEFDHKNLLGKAAFVSVVHKTKGDKTYAEIGAVIPLPKGTEVPKVVGDPIYYSEAGDMSPPELEAAYLRVPEWMRKRIDGQLKVTPPRQAPEMGGAVENDDIPF
jgi:hypothetical protein